MHFDPERGLLGQVKWNPKAQEIIRNGEYKYLSPAVEVRQSDRRAVALHSAALTNLPAIPRMEALAASTRAQANVDEPAAVGVPANLLQALARKLGFESDVSATEILQRAIEALSKEGDEEGQSENDTKVAESVRASLGLAKNAGANAVLLAMSLAGDAGARAEVMALKQQAAEREVDERLDALCRDGTLNPNNKEQMGSARRLALKDRAEFELLITGIKPFGAPPGKTTPPPRPTAGSRGTIIANARREYEKPGQHQRLTTSKAFVDLRLREAGQERLSDDEVRTLQE